MRNGLLCCKLCMCYSEHVIIFVLLRAGWLYCPRFMPYMLTNLMLADPISIVCIILWFLVLFDS